MRKVRFLFWLLLALLLAVPKDGWGVDYFDPDYNYVFSVNYKEPGCLHFKVLVLDQHENAGASDWVRPKGDGDWAYGATIYVKRKSNGTQIPLLSYYCDEEWERSNNYLNVWTYRRSENVGAVVLTNERTKSDSKDEYGVSYDGALLNSSNTRYTIGKEASKASCVQMEYDWWYPVDYAAEDCEFYIIAKTSGNASDVNYREMTGSGIRMDSKPDITLTDAIFMVSGKNAGYYSVLAPNTTGVNTQVLKATAYDVDGGNGQEITAQCKSAANGMGILIPATDYPHYVDLVCKVPFSRHIYMISDSKRVKLDAFHDPKNIKMERLWGFNGSSILTWTVPNSQYSDVLNGDLYNLERQLYTQGSTDQAGDWKSLGTITMEQGKSTYLFEDSTSGCYGDKSYNSVRYRLSRSLIGTSNNNYVIVENENASSQVKWDGTIKALPLEVNGQEVTIPWEITDVSNGLNTFLPPKYKVVLQREEKYYRNGQPESLVTATDITSLFVRTDITEDTVGMLTIKNADDWTKFRQAVISANGKSDVNAVLLTDLSITEPVGTLSCPYHGTFDGRGHTLNVTLSSGTSIAPIVYAGNFTIKNLNVSGTVEGHNYCAGLVAVVESKTQNTIANCRVSAKVKSNARIGGLIGDAYTSTNTITNCLFDGTATGEQGATVYYGAIVARDMMVDNKHVITNCVERSSYTNIASAAMCFSSTTPYGNNSLCTNNWSYSGFLNTQSPEELTDREMIRKLGDGWYLSNGAIHPRQISTLHYKASYTDKNFAPCTQYKYTLIYTFNDVSDLMPKQQIVYEEVVEPLEYVHEVNDFKASNDEYQDKIRLSWQIDLSRFTSVKLFREESGKSAVELPIDQRLKYFDDYEVEAGRTYSYRLLATYECSNGNQILSKTTTGQRRASGKIGGYIVFADGTGIGDVDVVLYRVNSSNQETEVSRMKSSASGAYLFDDVPYLELPNHYVVRVESSAVNFDIAQVNITLNKDQVYHYDKNFVSNSSYDFEGYVYYEQTTVPVYGATFTIDGVKVVDKSGNAVTTDNDGHFNFQIQKGAKNIRVHKEGHQFIFDGYYADNNGTHLDMTENKKSVFFWDQTKVHTIGRVVGGLDQGNKTLGFGLSRNNLGDDLRIVLELDGNLRSWLVKDQLNDTVRTRHQYFKHVHPTDSNLVVTNRRQVVIYPNSSTGEYVADLLPTRYKIVEVSAKGYSSLFQQGAVAEILDLSDSLHTQVIVNNSDSLLYQAQYNRIYRCEPTVTITQQNDDGTELPYIGIGSYYETTSSGTTVTTPIYDEKTKHYTFGYPLLRTGSYTFLIKGMETYYYNNVKTNVCDTVPLRGGKIKVYDDFASSKRDTLCELDEHTGAVSIPVVVANTVYDVSGTNALRHIDVTLEYNGQYIDGQSVQAFVLGTESLTDDVICSDGIFQVEGVLRDPPGSNSYSWIEKGTTYTSEFNYYFKGGLDVKIGLDWGSGTSITMGTWTGSGGGAYMGKQQKTSTYLSIDPQKINLVDGSITQKGSTIFELNERMQTSDDPSLVGADGDLYYGYELVSTSKIVRGVRVVDEGNYQNLKNMGLFDESNGVVRVIESGADFNGKKYYLISDVDYQLGPKVKSHFVYTQKYIVESLIPQLEKLRNSYFYKGTRQQAQARANETLEPVFYSLVPEGDSRYGQDNLDDSLEYITIDRYDSLRTKLNYEVVMPAYVDILDLRSTLAHRAALTDSIRILNQRIGSWQYMVATNEYEKLAAIQTIDQQTGRDKISYNPGTPYDVQTKDFYLESHTLSGGIPISHSESFDTNTSVSRNGGILGIDFSKVSKKGYWEKYFTSGLSSVVDIAADTGNSLLNGDKGVGGVPEDAVNDIIQKRYGVDKSQFLKYTIRDSVQCYASSKDMSSFETLTEIAKNMEGQKVTNVQVGGTYLEVSITPSISLSFDNTSNSSTSTKTIRGYELKADMDSHMTIEVYHDVKSDIPTRVNLGGSDTDFRTISAGNYIFRTLGGATKCPYEPAETTKMWKAGAVISNATAQVEKPRISVEKHIISGVPYGEKAKFNLVLSNEGSVVEEGSFDLVPLDATNQKGASLSMDGAPLGNGRSIVVPYGTGLVKVLEIGAGIVDDYEDMKFILRSQCDKSVADTVSLSVHFTPTASPIAVLSPSDKWVLNTNSAQDSRGRYYMPISVNGYDVNFRNFDHIELQYKQSAEPETRWTNLCSYYNVDSLYENGTGTKAMLDGNTINHTFYGDSDPVEMKYDLRAVTYSRLGNGYVTNASPIFSGIKDTRRPQVFGSPMPANGILGVGDDLKLVFSEPIDANRLLNTNNFKVSGQPNSSDVNTSTSLHFNEYTVLSPEAEHNFSNEDFTIDMMIKRMESDAKSFVLFMHNTNDMTRFLSFGYNEEHQLEASFYNMITSETFTFKSRNLDDINWNLFQRVMLTYNDQTKDVHIYVNGKNVDGSDNIKLEEGYSGNGTIYLGGGFKGNMLEVRIWNKELTQDMMNETSKSLYGYESGLVHYYPMNDGFGNYAEDKAQGAHIKLNNGASWMLPEGRALQLDGTQTLTLKDKLFERTTLAKDYSLSLWFRSQETSDFAILSSGIGDSLEVDPANKLFIGVKEGKLTVSNNSTSIVSQKSYADDQWHQLTFVVDRKANMASMYVDGNLMGQRAATLFGSPYGTYRVGSCHYQTSATQAVDTLYMKGYVDEITLWNMSLPQNVVQQKMKKSCDGSEIGLLAYIPFSEHVKQLSGAGTKVEFSDQYFYNQYDVDLKKDVTYQESAFVDGDKSKLVESKDVYAPVKEKGKIHYLTFNFITKDNELLIDLNEAPKDIERTLVNITVMGVEDQNGNEMAQPVIWSAFVNKNTVRWETQSKRIDIDPSKETDTSFEISIQNHGGMDHSYIIEGLPSWITLDNSNTGELGATETIPLTMTISKDINIGTYSNVIYLRNEEGLVDPLTLNIVKKGSTPDWTVQKSEKNLQITAQVMVGGNVLTNKNHIIAAFNDNDQCVGLGNVEKDVHGKSMLYLTVYGSDKTSSDLFFRMWDSSTGKIYGLVPDQQIDFVPDAMYGSYEDPVIFKASLQNQQHLDLTPTWTWISLNVKTPDARDINKLLRRGSWRKGDQLKDPVNESFYNFNDSKWIYSVRDVEDSLKCSQMYFIKSSKDQLLTFEGTPLIHSVDRRISIHDGWNFIGYTPTRNLPIQEALADFYGKASEGDLIKSQSEFATFSKAYGWTGNLKYMKPGQGYMLKHYVTEEHPDSIVSFVYPYKDNEDYTLSSRQLKIKPLLENTQPTTMTMVASAEGVETHAGDILQAFADGELCGMAEAVEHDGKILFFLSIGGSQRKALSYTVERDGQLLGSTASVDTYLADAIEGTTSLPKVIHFNDTSNYQEGTWYTISGVNLGKDRPTATGVYIFNGEKVVIK